MQGDSIQKFWTRHEVLTNWTFRKIQSMFNLSVLHVWFKTWMESPCMFNLFGSKLLDGIFLYVQFVSYWQIEHAGRFYSKVLNQTWSTDKLNIQEDSIQKFWIRHEGTSCLVQNFWIESPCMFNLSVLHVWFKTFGWNHPLCSTCQYFMSGSKLLEWVLTNWTYKKIPSKSFEPNKLNIQGDSIQVLNQTWSTDKLNIKEDSI
jgi:hypothetical protein